MFYCIIIKCMTYAYVNFGKYDFRKVELLLAIHKRVIRKLRQTYNTDMNNLINLYNEVCE